eukprot:gene8372-197_t
MEWLRTLFTVSNSISGDYQKSILDHLDDIKFPDTDEGIQLDSLYEDFEIALSNNELEKSNHLIEDFQILFVQYFQEKQTYNGTPKNVLKYISEKFVDYCFDFDTSETIVKQPKIEQKTTQKGIEKLKEKKEEKKSEKKEINIKSENDYILLEMIEILSRSIHNQCFLGYYKILGGVVKIIKYINTKILKGEFSLYFKEMLKICFQIMIHFSGAVKSLNVMIPFRSENILNASEIMKKFDTNRRHLNLMLGFLIESNSIEVILESFSLKQRFSKEEQDYFYSIEEAILHIFHIIFLGQITQKHDKFKIFDTIKILINRLEWPEELKNLLSKKKWNEIEMDKLDMDILTMEYDLQIFILRIFAQMMFYEKNYFNTFGELSLYDRMIDMGIWISFVFSQDEKTEGILERLKGNSIDILSVNENTPKKKSKSYFLTEFMKDKRFTESFHIFDKSGYIKKIPNEKFIFYFDLLTEFSVYSNLVKSDSKYDPKMNKKIINNEIPSDMENVYQLECVCMLTKLFQEKKDEKVYITQAREKLKYFSDFQFYFFDKLFYLTTKNDIFLTVLMDAHLYDIFFSDYFYFLGRKSKEINNKKIENEIISEKIEEEVKFIEKKNELISFASLLIRDLVFNVIKYNSYRSEQLHSHEALNEEAYKLLEIMGSNSNDSNVISEISVLVLDLFSYNEAAMHHSIHKLRAISIVSHVVKNQQLKFINFKGDKNELKKIEDARNLVVEVMDKILHNHSNKKVAMEDHNTINLLVFFLDDPQMRQFAFTQILKFMTIQIEDLDRQYEPLIDAYHQKLISLFKKEKPTDEDVSLILDMIKNLKLAMNDINQSYLQNEYSYKIHSLLDTVKYQESMFESQIITPENFCCEFLSTIGSLIFRNQNSRIVLQADDGYKKLENIVISYFKGNLNHNSLFSTLLDILVDGKFDENSCTIRTPDLILMMFNLIFKCEEEFVLNFTDKFIKIVEFSVSNQNSCFSCGLIDCLLNHLAEMEPKEKHLVFHTPEKNYIAIINTLIKHSIRVNELKTFFSLLRKQSEDTTSSILAELFKCLQPIASDIGPRSFFAFDGKDSGLELPEMKKLPLNGYSISMWFRIESFRDLSLKQQNIPRLFCFLNSNHHGFEAFFEPPYLVACLYSPNGSVTKIPFDFQFQMKTWYHVILTHYPGRSLFTKTELKMYIDGKLKQKIAIKYPESKDYNFSTIGVGQYQQNAFHGQIGSIYMFEDILSTQTINALYTIGSNYNSTFHQSDAYMFDKNIQFLFDGSLSSKLLLALNPKSTDKLKTICVNNALENNPHWKETYILPGTNLCNTYKLRDIISCLGGIKVIFPLFLQMDKMTHTDDSQDVDTYLVNQLLKIVIDLLDDHKNNQYGMEISKGFYVINFLLKQISPKHINDYTVQLLPQLLSTIQSQKNLFQDVVTCILFDFKLWVYTAPYTQKLLISKLIQFSENEINFREIVGVQNIIDSMRLYYWYTYETDFSEAKEKIYNLNNELLSERPQKDDIVEIRGQFFDLIKEITKSDPNASEIAAMINFIANCPDILQIEEMLKFTLNLMIGPNALSVCEHIMNTYGYQVFHSLLSHKTENIRLLALKNIGRILKLHSKTRQTFEQTNGFTLISTNLGAFPLTVKTFQTLKEIIFGNISTKFSTSTKDQTFDTSKCDVPSLFGTIFSLLLVSDIDTTYFVIQNLRIVLKSKDVRSVLLLQPDWQKWILKLYVHVKIEESKQKPQILDQILDIFCDLVFHTMIWNKNSWRVLDELVSNIYFYNFGKSERGILSKIYSKLLNLYKRAIEKKIIPSTNLTFESPQHFILGNLLHLIIFIEEFLFYHESVGKELENLVKKKPFPTPSPKSSILRKNIEFTPQPLLSPFPNLDIDPNNSPMNTPDSKRAQSFDLNTSTEIPELQKSATFYDTLGSIQSFFKKPSTLSYDAEDEIDSRRKPDGSWMDLPLVEDCIYLLDYWKIACISNFRPLSKIIGESKHLRSGGTLRITLRFIRHSLFESKKLNDSNLQLMMKIIERDLESELEMDKYRELWASTGNLDEMEDYHSRILIILHMVISVAEIAIDDKEQLLLFEFAKKIFILRNESYLLNKLKIKGKKILTPEFTFLKKERVELKEYLDLLQTDNWKEIWDNYFEGAIKKVENEEGNFLTPIIQRRKATLNKMKKDLTKSFDIEQSKISLITDINALVNEISLNETKRCKLVKSKLDDFLQNSSRLWKNIMVDLTHERGPWGLSGNVIWKLDKTENSRRMRLKLKRDNNPIDHSNAANSSAIPMEDLLVQEKKSVNKLLEVTGGSFFIPKLLAKSDETSSGGGSDSIEEREEEELVFESTIEEKTLMKVYCEMITPMQGFSGQIELTNKRLIWNPDKINTVEQFGVNEITNQLQKNPKEKIILVEDIREVHLRRHRLQNSAIEIFLVKKRNLLFNFQKNERNRIYRKILSTRPPNLCYEHVSLSPSDNFNASNVTKLWQKRKISNFDYLMKLNTFAGRSYNDLTQYPVFPWILKDYQSKTLDLSSKESYRDFSNPIGAQNKENHKDLRSKYKDLTSMQIPAFHYGSHYSNSGIVLYFLIRLEPFTTYSRILQGGRFDHADRLFSSIPATWKNCICGSADYKELIPEFFYSPEFLEMTNDVNLGTTQKGKKISNIELPPWASTPEEFIRIHREALESEYVSDHLHEWIDLIFGYKQRGKESVEYLNAFHPLTYEGNADFTQITDSSERRSIIAQIENFGQTPVQLLTKPHPKRQKLDEIFSPLLHNPSSLKEQFSKPVSNARILKIITFHDRVITVCANGFITQHKYSFMKSVSDSTTTLKRIIGLPFSSEVNLSSQCIDIDQKDTVYSAAHWDHSFKITNPNTNSIQSINRHKGVVTCLALSEDQNYLVTGSIDTTIMIWGISSNGELETRNILYGHEDEITCLAVSEDLDIVISGSKDKTIIIHTLLNGKYVRSISLPKNQSVDQVKISKEGNILVYSDSCQTIFLYSINAKLLKIVKSTFPVSIMSIVSSKFLIQAGARNIIVRQIEGLSLVYKYQIQTSAITSIAISKDERIMFVGLKNGKMIVFHCFQIKKL